MTIQEQINQQVTIIKEATKKLDQLFILRNNEQEKNNGQITIEDLKK